MNTKIKALIASGILFATALPVVACAKKAPEAILVPIDEPAIIETTETEATTDAVEINMPVQNQAPVSEATPIESLMEVKETENKSETKKTTKKAAKKTKKTTKKAKKSKKTNKKSNKKATSPRFTYGTSIYTAKNFTISVHIKKDNSIHVTVINDRPNKSDKAQFIYEFSGKINPNTGLFTYSNGSKDSVVYAHIKQVRSMYRGNASGYMTFNGNSLTWFDGADHIANDVTFHKQ